MLSHETYANTFDQTTLANLIADEVKYSIDPHYLEKNQPHLRWEMRAILLDWLQEVCSDYLFKRESFHYAANILDRFLARESNLSKADLQLVGVAALFLAAKMEEVYTPKIDSMVVVADHAYSAAQIRSMEMRIYSTLEFMITPPTLNMWCQVYI